MLANKIQDNKLDLIFLGSLFVIAMARVLATDSIGCPEFFDCNAYIRMTHDLTPGTDVLGHHSMRVVPIIIVRFFMMLGIPLETAFNVLSGLCYIGFGIGAYWFIQRITNQKLYAFSWALILLALHEAIRIPLYLVYQANDALVYPLGLCILVATYYRKMPLVLFLSLLGALTRQNLFVMGFLCLMYLAKKQKNFYAGIAMALLTVAYFLHQNYHGAHSVFAQLLSPPKAFFSLQGQWWILTESQFLELWVAILPFMILGLPQAYRFLRENWHWLIYAGVTIFQPYVGYHLTGNNLPRLALQGIWVIALALSLSSPLIQYRSKGHQGLLLAYAIAIYATWGITQRLWIVAVYLLILGIFYIYGKRLTSLQAS